MFDKLKKIKQLKELQDSLSQEKTEVKREGVKVVVNGKMEIEQIQLSLELEKTQQEEILRQCLNEAMRKVQMAAAQKMSQMSDFGL